MITTVTLNTMVDKIVCVSRLQKGKIERAHRVDMIAGGKGVNVSRQLQLLGCDTIATGFYGGETGMIISRLLTGEGIRHDFVTVDSMTREGVTYRESEGTITAVFEPPHTVSRVEAAELTRKCMQLAEQSTWITCNGSSPHRNANRIYRDILVKHARTKVRTVLDTYGESLRLSIDTKPHLFKPNKQEYEKTFNVVLDSEKSYRDALDECLKQGIECTIITNGEHPVYAATPEGHWIVYPPDVKTVNATGSGDALIAGYIYASENNKSFEECTITGVAAGAANAQQWQVAKSSLEEILRLKEQVTIRKL